MHLSVYLPLVLTALFASLVRPLTRHLDPALATRTIAAGAVVTAGAGTCGLLLLALSTLGATPCVRGRGVHSPAPLLVGAGAVVLLVLAVRRAARVLTVRRQTGRALLELCRTCNPQGELVVVVDEAAHALAVPGRPGRVLVSTGLLRATTAAEQTVVLAHERAHLRHHHHRYRAATELAAALNPLVIPARVTVAFLIERWADEAAAQCVDDRDRTARTLADIALRLHAGAAPSASLAFHRDGVVERVRALRAPLVRSHGWVAATLAGPAVLSAAAAGDATLAFTRLLLRLVAS